MFRPASTGRVVTALMLLAVVAVHHCCAGATHVAGSTTYTWAGTNNSDFANPYNWQGGTPPSSDGTNTIAFATTINNGAELTSNFSAFALSFTASTPVSAWISSQSGSSTLTLGPGGITLTPSGYASFNNLTLNLAADQTWNLSTGGLSVSATLAGSGALTVNGSGSLYLQGGNSSTGTLTINGSSLSLGASGALGSGNLVLGDNSRFTASFGNASFANALELHPGVTFNTSSTNQRNFLTFSGPVTLAATSTASQPFSFSTNIAGKTVLEFANSLAGVAGASGTNLTVNGGGILLLSGSTGSEFTSMTAANSSAIVFNSAGALPSTTTLSATSGGIISVAGPSSSSNALLSFVLAGITSPSTFSGTLSLDTDFRSTSSSSTYSGTLNFSSFSSGSFTIGSLTSATIDASAVIAPPAGGSFSFGNGGGRLVVQAPLVDPVGAASGTTGLSLSSSLQPLTVVLQGANTFTGNVDVTRSFLVLDGANVLPSTATISLGASGYVSSTPNWHSGTPSFLINAVSNSTYSSTSVIGFDSAAPATQAAVINSTIDLSRFPTALYLGTTTHGLTLSAEDLIKPSADGVLKFAALQGGSFIINADLISANGVSQLVFGHTDSSLVNGITNAGSGNYQLGGNNTYTGGTTIYNGGFTLSSTSPFGSGSLSIDASAGSVALDPTVSVSLSQNIVANNSQLNLGDSAGTSPLTLAGILSGAAKVSFSGTVNLNGLNTYTGGSVLNTNTTVNVLNNTGLGSGSVTLGSGSSAGVNPASVLVFGATATAPSIGSLSGTGTVILPSLTNSFTINQGSTQSTFTGAIEATDITGSPIWSTASLVVYSTSQGSLAFAGTDPNLYSGGTVVNAGKIRIQNDSTTPLGYSTSRVTLDGATLSMEQSISGSAVVLPNPLGFSDSSTSVITGRGTLLAPGGLTVNSLVDIAPGFSTDDSSTQALVYVNTSDHSAGKNLGTLTFGSTLAPTHLNFASGGSLGIHIDDPTLAAGVGYGTLTINGTIDFTSTALQPFNLKLFSGGKGGYDPASSNNNVVLGNTYSLVLATATQGITHFDATTLKLDLSQLSIPSNITISDWSLSLGSSNTQLLLNFTPVPEPETWVMLGLGALAAFILENAVNRRKRRQQRYEIQVSEKRIGTRSTHS